MRAFISVFKIRFKMGLAYRVAAYAGATTQFFWGFMLIMIFRAFYASSTASPPMEINQLTTYLWLQQALLMLISTWSVDRELINMISTGNVSYELCRPQNLYWLWLAKMFSTRISAVILRCVPIFAVTFFLPEGYRFCLPVGFGEFIYFLISLFLGSLLVNAYTLIAHFILFYVISGDGILMAFSSMAIFFSGQFVPIALLPDKMQSIMYRLPFAYVNDFSFRIYMGSIPLSEGVTGIIIQIAWIAVFIIFGYALLNKALKKMVIQGG